MLLPVKWLRDYVNIDLDAKKIANGITDTGSHVETIILPKEGMEKVVVGKILKIEKHPDADKLVICKVDLGTEVLQIVTGAPNVFEGAVVPVALVGAKLAKGVQIEAGELRGVKSDGMLCSLEELGYDTSTIAKKQRDGIFIFNEDVKPGTDAFSALMLDQEIIDIEVTPNRPDCLSIIGMARECAATFDLDLTQPKIHLKEEGEGIEGAFGGVEIETDKCSRFYGRVIEDIKIEESPLWLQNYLVSVGVRPINNIVDLTNFVMIESGQPLHAYDLNSLHNKKIVVKQARDGEVFKTLDDVERKLTSDDIVITDGIETIGLAGVMGGLDTEIEDTTKDIFIEGAHFDEDSIRKTSKRLNLRTEASARFEKGVSPKLSKWAVDRFCALVEELNAGTVLKGSFDVGANNFEKKFVDLRVKKANKLMGIEVAPEKMVEILNSLEVFSTLKGDIITAEIPDFRSDLNIEEDLIEEISRIYGFKNIPPKPLEGKLTRGGKPKSRNLEEKIKSLFLSMGYNEFMSFSFIGNSDLDKLNLPADSELRNTLELINPLGEEFKIMRRTLIPSMLEILSRNFARKNEVCAGFEFGNIFIKESGELPVEKKRIILGSYGLDDFYGLKEVVELGLRAIGVKGLTYERSEKSYLHPGRSAKIFYGDKYLGDLGEVHPNVLKNYGIKKRAYVADIDFDLLKGTDFINYTFTELPKHPAMKRDFAVVLNQEIPVYEIEKIAREKGGSIVESFNVFDIYQGEHVEEGMKSVAFSVVFRHKDRTLVEEEVTTITDKILKDIEEKLGGVLRS